MKIHSLIPILLYLALAEGAESQEKHRLYDSADSLYGFYLKFESDKASDKAVIICPGGGYSRISINHEGIDAGRWLTENGFDAYVLHYRVSDEKVKYHYPSQLEDVERLFGVLRKKYGTIGIMGFSAGGHLAGMFLVSGKYRVDFGVLIYPVISTDSALRHKGSFKALLGPDYSLEIPDRFSVEKRIGRKTPPMFLVHAMDDRVVPYRNSVLAYEKSRNFDKRSELHLFDKGGHGFGMRKMNLEIDSWSDRLLAWLDRL